MTLLMLLLVVLQKCHPIRITSFVVFILSYLQPTLLCAVPCCTVVVKWTQTAFLLLANCGDARVRIPPCSRCRWLLLFVLVKFDFFLRCGLLMILAKYSRTHLRRKDSL